MLCIVNNTLQRSSPFACFLSLSIITLPLCTGLGTSSKLSNIGSYICFGESLTELESIEGIGEDGRGGDVMRKSSFVTKEEEEVLFLLELAL